MFSLIDSQTRIILLIESNRQRVNGKQKLIFYDNFTLNDEIHWSVFMKLFDYSFQSLPTILNNFSTNENWNNFRNRRLIWFVFVVAGSLTVQTFINGLQTFKRWDDPTIRDDKEPNAGFFSARFLHFVLFTWHSLFTHQLKL